MKGSGEVDDHLNDRERRERFARDLMKSISVAGRASELKVTGPDGSKPIVVAHDHELISAVMGRVQQTEGFANLFVSFPDGRLALVAVLPANSALFETDAEPIAAQEIHSDSTIGILLEVARSYAEGVMLPVRLTATTADVTPLGEFAAV
jgi:hypothetical protein